MFIINIIMKFGSIRKIDDQCLVAVTLKDNKEP